LTNYYDKSKLDQQKCLTAPLTYGPVFRRSVYNVSSAGAKHRLQNKGLAGQFSGIGAELGTKGKNIIVIAPLDGSPAEKTE